jgi:hypothetical protein
MIRSLETFVPVGLTRRKPRVNDFSEILVMAVSPALLPSIIEVSFCVSSSQHAGRRESQNPTKIRSHVSKEITIPGGSVTLLLEESLTGTSTELLAT